MSRVVITPEEVLTKLRWVGRPTSALHLKNLFITEHLADDLEHGHARSISQAFERGLGTLLGRGEVEFDRGFNLVERKQ